MVGSNHHVITPFPLLARSALVLQALLPSFRDPFPAVLIEADRTSKLPGKTTLLQSIFLSKLDQNVLEFVAVAPNNFVLDVAQPHRLFDQALDFRNVLLPP